MITTVTKQFLKDNNACDDGCKYWCKCSEPDLYKFSAQCIKDDHFDYANWLIVRCMDRPQYLRYAIYSAKQCLADFEQDFPDNKSVRDAIKAAEKVLKNDTAENRAEAELAASSAYSAAYLGAYSGVYSSAYSARSAAGSDKKMQAKLIKYGIRIMKKARTE